uniref:Uncharacterized protein n=1 Tax=Romanomermis culicivorax TaxID=13658 RepID=A0A915IMW6_ROMCU
EDDLEYVKQLIYKNEIEKLNDGHSYVVPDDLEITDVRVDNHLSDVRETLLKNITTKPPDAMLLAAQMASGTSGGGKKAKPDPKAKRKHQITYLAHLVSLLTKSV